MLRRPEADLSVLRDALRGRPRPRSGRRPRRPAAEEERDRLVSDLRYEGFVARERETVARVARAAERVFPSDFVYRGIPGLSKEAIEKLERHRPADARARPRACRASPPPRSPSSSPGCFRPGAESRREPRRQGPAARRGSSGRGARPAPSSAAGRLAGFLSFLLEKNAAMNLVSARSADPGRPRGNAPLRLSPRPRTPAAPAEPARSGFSISARAGASPPFRSCSCAPTSRELSSNPPARRRRISREALERLALTARVVNARFPDSFPMAENPRYDVLTTRAVASAGKLVRAARPLLSPGARALLWTSEPLAAEAARTSGATRSAFRRAPGAERRGILSLECFT